MSIKERIEKIKDYFVAMQVQNVDGEDIIYVIVKFPPKWLIDERLQKKYDVSVVNGNQGGEYYFCVEMEKGFDVVFDAIEANVNFMKTAQERASLLKQKVEELQTLFMNENISIEVLRTLTFNYEKTKTRTRKTVKQEEIKQENESTNV